MSLQNLKDRYEALPPKKKKLVTFGGPLLIIIFLWMILSSDEDLLKVPERNISEVGLFGVDDEDMTLGDLSTKVSALANQVELMSQRENTNATSLKRIEDILQSLNADNTNLQTLYEIQRRISELDEKIADVQVEAKTHRTERATITYVETKEVAEPEPGEAITVETDLPPSITKKETTFDTDEESFSYSAQRTEIPEDPITFVNQASRGVTKQIKTDSGNMFVNSDSPAPSSPVKSTTSLTDEEAKADSGNEDDKKYRGKRILAGAVVPFVLINGFEAPAGEAASEFPTSATVRLTGPAILPNGYSVDLTGCFITNLVRGDAATERAKLRTDHMTCKYDYGEVDIAVKGFASGHDGSAGLRGRLVNNKRDKILLYGTLTGGLAGVGQAFGGNGAQGQVAIGGGPFQLPESRDVAIAGGTSAVSNAADFLTEYYRSKLQEYYDVIEVKPLVTGTIHFLETFKMDLLDD